MKKQLLLIFGAAAIYSKPMMAQFQEAIGDNNSQYAKSVQYDNAEKRYILAGQTAINADANITKVDKSGNLIWSIAYGDKDKDQFNSLRVVPDSIGSKARYVAVGQTASYGAGNYDFFLVGTDNSGIPVFTNTFGRNGLDVAYQVQVVNTKSEQPGFIIVGETSSYPNILPGKNIYVVNTDINGNFINSAVVGTPFDEEGYAIEQTRDGGYIIAGYTTAKTQTDVSYNKNIYVVKLNNNLAVVWSTIAAGITGQDDIAYSIKENLIDSSIIVTGSTKSYNNLAEEIFLLNLKPTGQLNWFHTYNGPGDERGHSVLVTNDGNGNNQYAIAGYTNNSGPGVPNVLFFKTKLDGSLLWSRAYGAASADYTFELAGNYTKANEYALAGHTLSYGAGAEDILLIETDNNGKTGSPCEKEIRQTAHDYKPTISEEAKSIIVKDYIPTQTVYKRLEYRVNKCKTSDIAEYANDNSLFKVSPVPANSNVTITFSDDYAGANLTVFNNLGATVGVYKLTSGSINFSVADLTTGIYFLRAVKADGTIRSVKFVKE